jgi:hypothetical protein
LHISLCYGTHVIRSHIAAAKAKAAAPASSQGKGGQGKGGKGQGEKGTGQGGKGKGDKGFGPDPVTGKSGKGKGDEGFGPGGVLDHRDPVTIVYDMGDGGNCSLVLESSADMVDVKTAIIARMGFPVTPNDLTLFCGRREMTDDLTLRGLGFGGGRPAPVPYMWTTDPSLPNF